jgi:DNA-binding MarR family transcriptional regulator
MRRSGAGDLARVDHALLRLRRMWDAPRGITHEGGVVEGSTLLVCLAVTDAAGAVGVAEVAEALGVAPSTASRLVARAADAGMVTREVSTTDPRRAALELTPAGIRLVGASRRYRAARLARLLVDWPSRDIAALADLLTRFADAFAPPANDLSGRQPRRSR